MMTSLSTADLAMFARLRVLPELLERAGIRRVDDATARHDYGFNGSGRNDGIVFPYISPVTGYRVTARLRRDHPDFENGKVKGKYLLPYGDRRHLFFPPGARQLLQDKKNPACLVEAEKSALALTAWAERTGRKILPIALGGCHGWRGRIGKADDAHGERVDEMGALPDLVAACTGRMVFILLDANVATNPQVKAAQYALIAALQKMKADIRVLNLPSMDGMNGPDDYIGLAGDDAMSRLFESAKQVSGETSAYSDDDLSLRFTATHGSHLRYTSETGHWHRWNGTHWKEDRGDLVLDLSRKICRDAAKELDCIKLGRGRSLASNKTIRNVVALTSTDPGLTRTVDEWDSDPMVLNAENGIVDLRNGSLLAHAQEFYMSKIAETGFAASPTPPLWSAFLKRVTANNAELEDYLGRIAGYCLTGSTREHAFFFLHGSGSNGKSVFVNTIAGILGPYARTAPAETFLASSTAQHPTDLAGLRGSRLVTATEIEPGRRWAESRIKMLTGDDKVSARFMHKNFFDFRPTFKLVITGNHKPALRDVGPAVARRLHLVPFVVQIPEAECDLDLTEKLRAEWPSILGWMVRGCLEWQRVGLNPPAMVRSATDEYLQEENRVHHWIDCNCERDAQAFTPVSVLYANWKDWAESNGEWVLSRKSFSQALETIPGITRDRTAAARGFYGIRLKPWDQREHSL